MKNKFNTIDLDDNWKAETNELWLGQTYRIRHMTDNCKNSDASFFHIREPMPQCIRCGISLPISLKDKIISFVKVSDFNSFDLNI